MTEAVGIGSHSESTKVGGPGHSLMRAWQAGRPFGRHLFSLLHFTWLNVLRSVFVG